ncbi:GNAT family N-acetyltransferase [Cedecea sp. NFIX57]|uniref:GNAT family N-acetyltransferase n=1 Tax=Cedecea sp. NFIX57 TaxID=1566286 RepID=UPI000A0B4199|nr:GNAT family N-acetyltransferase [Cedecea sp. NFIX57]NIG76474.1 GNAT family N-acetyltransferase [Klebsiella sp. Ap-873]SMG26068.1 Protein N-acetyltransferase, RimJ/RimL family [Cedecea sp. NFIX57]
MNVNKLESRTIYMRLATVNDAAFIHQLRTNEHFNKHLSTTTGKIEDQRKWLSDYKLREVNGSEYYFIIIRSDTDQPIGTVRLYDFREKDKSFCWGSWILDENKTRSSALESALLVYLLAFERLGFMQSHFDVRRGNEKVIEFHKKLGATEVSSNDVDLFFVYEKNTFSAIKDSYKKYLVQNG